MNKQEVFALLRRESLWYEITEHQAVVTMEDLAKVPLPYPEADAKNLFVRDEKKRNYYIITVLANKRVDLKEFRNRFGTSKLSFASAEDLETILGLIPGAVTPMGLLNDEERKVKLFLDSAFVGGIIGVHPNDNTATVWMKTDDLVTLLEKDGHPLEIVEV